MAGGYCPAPDPEWGLVKRLVGTVDCNIDGLAARSYAALADGPMAAILTTLLTLYVAFIGYRLLLGRGPVPIGDVVIAAFKVGAVLLLATHWSAYQVLVYDALSNGPQQVAAQLLASVRPDGSALGGDPLAGLQAAYDTLAGGAEFVGGRAGAASPFVGGVASTAAALNGSALLLLVSTLGVLLTAKIVLALLLALAPVLIGLTLFDVTRGVVQGWVAAAIGFALAPMSVVLTLSVELVALTPLLARLTAARIDGEIDASTALSTALLVLVFTAVLGGLLLAGAVMAAGVRFPSPRRRSVAENQSGQIAAAPMPTSTGGGALAAPGRDRAAQVGAALVAMERRDQRLSTRVASTASGDRRMTLSGPRTDPPVDRSMVPLGSSYRRAPLRKSASISARDRRQTPRADPIS